MNGRALMSRKLDPPFTPFEAELEQVGKAGCRSILSDLLFEERQG